MTIQEAYKKLDLAKGLDFSRIEAQYKLLKSEFEEKINATKNEKLVNLYSNRLLEIENAYAFLSENFQTINNNEEKEVSNHHNGKNQKTTRSATKNKFIILTLCVIIIGLISIGYFLIKKNDDSYSRDEYNSNQTLQKNLSSDEQMKNRISNLYKSGNNKDLNSLLSCYSFPVDYWSKGYRSYDDMKSLFDNAWDKKVYSKNSILELVPINDNACSVKIRYEWETKDERGKINTIDCTMEYSFDEAYKITSEKRTQAYRFEDDCKDVLNQWNNLKNNQDLNAVYTLYDDNLRYYTQQYSNFEVYSSHERFFNSNFYFYQWIDNEKITPMEYGTYKIEFDKHASKNNDEEKTYPSYLILRYDSNEELKIITESDYETDKYVR